MTWFKVCDHLHDHAKVRGIDPAALGLWTLAGSWAGDQKTDGFVPDTVVPRWDRRWRKLAATLVERGLWEPATRGRETGWVFHDWTDHQPPKDDTSTDIGRLRWRRKNALSKNRDLCEKIQLRDGTLCRYCAERVTWADKKGPRGATYDHVDPDGINSLENVVVACRRCNGRKRDRTPAEAGMVLLPAPGSAADSTPGSQIGSQIIHRPLREAGPEPDRSRVGTGTGPALDPDPEPEEGRVHV